MLDVTIYYKDGRRSRYVHVAQITYINNNLVFDFITPFNDHTEKSMAAVDSIERLMVKLYD